jgi:hypothetical protein
MPSINGAYTWGVNCCNLPNVGYSQTYRNQQTVNGITYYDCSSYINYALLAGGWETPGYAPNSNAFTTYTMEGVLQSLGFTDVTASGIIKPGDIGVSSTHTDMCYEGGEGSAIFMGAHTSNAPLANQVSIGSSSGDATYRRTFPRIWRYGDGASGEVGYTWIIGGNSEYFEDYGNKQKNNAACIYSYFYFKGWTLQSIAALCGNIMQESKFNPALIEIGGTGHGLVQWTPPSNLYDVLDVLYGNHDDWESGDKQCSVLYAEYQESTGEAHTGIEPQWYQTSAYPISWKEWASSTSDPGELALAFQANYERPASLHQERAEYARKWFGILKTIDPKQPGTNTRDPAKKMPVWMKINYHL